MAGLRRTGVEDRQVERRRHDRPRGSPLLGDGPGRRGVGRRRDLAARVQDEAGRRVAVPSAFRSGDRRRPARRSRRGRRERGRRLGQERLRLGVPQEPGDRPRRRGHDDGDGEPAQARPYRADGWQPRPATALRMPAMLAAARRAGRARGAASAGRFGHVVAPLVGVAGRRLGRALVGRQVVARRVDVVRRRPGRRGRRPRSGWPAAERRRRGRRHRRRAPRPGGPSRWASGSRTGQPGSPWQAGRRIASGPTPWASISEVTVSGRPRPCAPARSGPRSCR